SGSMKNSDQIAQVGALKILVAGSKRIQRKAFHGLGEKRNRLYLGIHGLGKVFRKGQPEDKRAEIVQRSHAPDVMRENGLPVQFDIFTSLVLLERASAAVNHAEKIKVEVGRLAGASPEDVMEFISALGEVLGPKGSIHAAVDGPIERIAQDCAFAG